MMLASLGNVNLVKVYEAGEISEGFYTTGQLGRLVREQSLIVETENGLTVVTGCSHPGVENILEAASRFGEIYGLVGGLHGFGRLEALRGLRLIVPCHCTVRKNEIAALYPEMSSMCSAGRRIQVYPDGAGSR